MNNPCDWFSNSTHSSAFCSPFSPLTVCLFLLALVFVEKWFFQAINFTLSTHSLFFLYHLDYDWSFGVLFSNYKLTWVNFLSQGGAARWCIGLQKIQGSGITILGGMRRNWKLFIGWLIFVDSTPPSLDLEIYIISWALQFSLNYLICIKLWQVLLLIFFQ